MYTVITYYTFYKTEHTTTCLAVKCENIHRHLYKTLRPYVKGNESNYLDLSEVRSCMDKHSILFSFPLSLCTITVEKTIRKHSWKKLIMLHV
jgi:hypothetical protein